MDKPLCFQELGVCYERLVHYTAGDSDTAMKLQPDNGFFLSSLGSSGCSHGCQEISSRSVLQKFSLLTGLISPGHCLVSGCLSMAWPAESLGRWDQPSPSTDKHSPGSKSDGPENSLLLSFTPAGPSLTPRSLSLCWASLAGKKIKYSSVPN
jgi:hypothetical protein